MCLVLSCGLLCVLNLDLGLALETAHRLLEGVESQQTNALGADHPDVLLTRYNRACLHAEQGNLGEAKRLCHEVAQKQASLLGVDHPDTVRTQANLEALGPRKGAFNQRHVVPPQLHSKNANSQSCVVM
eukprot:SAG31_NODE_445_length_15593_cov_8.514974_4_plen_129_part_00